jgi:hypothetical protein
MVTQPLSTLPTLQPAPEDERRTTAIAELDKYIGDEGTIRPDLLGGLLPKDLDIEELKKTGKTDDIVTVAKTLQDRDVARNLDQIYGDYEGYRGIFGQGGYGRFLGAKGEKKGYVDPYGQLTAIGKQAELAETPELPTGTELQLQRLTPSADEFLDADKYKVTPTAFNVEAAQAEIAQAADPNKTLAQSYGAQQAFERVAKQQIQAARQEGLTDYVEPAQGEVDVKSTVQGQLASLMQQFEGGQIPAFAAGAIRTAEQRLAARGLGASSMAGAAITQAAMEASTPIAAADAETYRRMNELNLNNRQQAEVLNAQMTLQMDLQNLSNEQQARVTNTQNRVQALFTDQAATNSARQFNAQSEQQNDQFFANLFNQTAQFNAAQTNAINQFNAGQANTISRFNSELANQRDQFNTRNRILIDQANAVYRRQINTANTAIANAENEYNVRNLFNISQLAQANVLQDARDKVNFARVNSLNEQQYQYELALQSFAADKNLENTQTIASGQIVGNVLASAADAIFTSVGSTNTNKKEE